MKGADEMTRKRIHIMAIQTNETDVDDYYIEPDGSLTVERHALLGEPAAIRYVAPGFEEAAKILMARCEADFAIRRA